MAADVPTTQFQSILRSLLQGAPLSHEQQLALSDLPAEHASAFLSTWGRLSERDRLKVLAELRQIEAANLRLDFSRVYRAVLQDPAIPVRAAAIQTNAEDESPQFLETLLRALDQDPSAQVRAAAAEALAPFAYRAELGQLDEQTAVRVQTGLLRKAQDADEAVEVRGQALASLGYFSAEEKQAVIRAALENPSLERAAIRGAGRSADPRWLDRLLEYTHRPEPEIRQEAAQALGEIEDERAAPRLIELIEDPSREVRLAALRALGQIGGDETREALEYAATSDDPATAKAAEDALSELQSREEPLSF